MSTQSLARTAGALYLLNIVGGAFAIGVVPSVVGADVRAYELLYRSAIAAHVLVTLTNVPLALIFFELFKIVNRRVALLVVFFTLVATAIECAAVSSQVVSLSSGGSGLEAAGDAGYLVSSIFFAAFDLAIAYLIVTSTFMPRWIGFLMALAGASYMTYAFAALISPDFAVHLVPYLQLPSLLGEGSFCLWLLIAGVNVGRWSAMEAA